MMKKWLPILMLTLLTGCNEPKHVSGSDFKREFELRNDQTMVWSEYLGEKDGKVFLRRKTMSLVSKDKWNEEIWFTETNDLDSAFLEQLEPLHVTTPKGFTAVTEPQKAIVARVQHLTRGMSVAEVKEHLGHPAEESPSLLFYHLAEDASGGYYVTVRLVFDKRGLATAELGFGHVSMELKTSE